ncbi:hypothetical protein CDEST_04473 [Colletotrichum destructivum]|uniref:Uncharacterized protein n=1 Tax=Colletotrichum destructivum TaxID=34406 RepID=A0AAX4I7W1_9PEZI|nr:hypothetical protein CDEST_04473 [Colletotrichum destructivum]
MMIPVFLLAAAAACLAPAAAQSPSKTTEKSTVWMPPRSTGAGENIYASVITAAPSSTEFFLACTTAWQSASACAQFSGVTLTYGDGTMKIGFRSDSYDCKRGASATCSVSTTNAANAQSVLAGPESSAWFTAITIVDGHDKLKSAKSQTRSTRRSTSASPAAVTATTTAASAGSNGNCKRAIKGGSSSGSGGDDGNSGGTSGKKHKDNSNGNGCSAASGGPGELAWSLVMAAAAAVVGSLVTVFL